MTRRETLDVKGKKKQLDKSLYFPRFTFYV